MLNLEKHWYRDSLTPLTMFLLPFSWCFGGLVKLRRFIYRFQKTTPFTAPIIVVGNITVGGTGKTPMVIWLVNFLKKQGLQPGIVSRGVGGKQQIKPRWVTTESKPDEVGDEAILLVRNTEVPLVIGIDRVAAVHELLAKTKCNIVISDDGMQHYRLHRDMEIALIDPVRHLGNKQLLPAGPLRESPARLKTVDFVLEDRCVKFENAVVSVVNNNEKKLLTELNKKIHAIAGIGHPQRFFDLLCDAGFDVIKHVFPDHYLYQPSDIYFQDDLPVIMTEKDAVKCKYFADARHWFLPISLGVDEKFSRAILTRLKELI